MSAALKTDDYMYTYKMYCEMPDDGKRYEIIDGVPYMMAAPSRQHQAVQREIFGRLYVFLQGKPCEVFVAPFDVRLSLYRDFGDDAINVVQPDVMVFCDQSRLDEKGGTGAPDIAVEILSPSSAMNDRHRKFSLYERAEVKEYWIVDGANKTVEVFVLHEGKLNLHAFLLPGDRLASTVLSGFEFDVSSIFTG